MAARLGFESLRPRIVVALAGASLLLIAPMPGVVLDLLLVAQALAAGLAVHRALDERADPAVLPRLLLAGALGRVLVAVALVRAASGHGGMGLVVGSLGVVLQSGGLLGGLGAVLALALLHVMVVARGAERLGQVSARFAWDALPGRQLALEGARRGFTANAICAGVTRTPALEKIPGHEAIAAKAVVRNPHGRLTTPDDVAQALVALAGPETRWINGNTIFVDGGEAAAG